MIRQSWKLTIPPDGPQGETWTHSSDMDNAGANEWNLRDRRDSNMVRMFKRLLRGGTKQHVTGVWVW